MKITVCLILTTCLQFSNSGRILGHFIAPSISHQFTFQPIWKELALRGHQVTVISPNILRENITNLREIDVGHSYNVVLKNDIEKIFGKQNGIYVFFHRFLNFVEEVLEDQFENSEVQEIINGNDTAFDLILVEGLSPIVHAWAGKFKVPVVAICSSEALFNGYDSVGNPTHPVLTPELMFDFKEELTFWNRLESFVFSIVFRFIYQSYWIPRYDQLVRRYFGEDLPSVGELERNVSLLLLNVNPLVQKVRPNVPAIIEITQMHIKPPKELPSDIKQFLDSATEGFVYFSLGSNVKSSTLDPKVRQTILEALGSLPYKVLWKWETDHLPGQPSNVKIAKWLPQQDVLSHPNIIAFVTQGGLQSIEESLTNAVPMVGIPFIGDQPTNIKILEKKGVAKYVEYLAMTKESLKNDILEVATNKKYREKALEFQSILTDVPMKGLDKAMWWIEYVLRHQGADHIVSPTRDMPYWKYFCLDVIGFVLVVIISCVFILYKLLAAVFSSRKQKTKVKKN